VDVLVVDDSEAIRSRLAARLREAGLSIAGEVGTSAEVLAFIALRVPDAVVLDLQLPDGSGLDLLPHLKASVPAPVVVVLTNAARPRYRKRCLALGADYVFDKSSEFDSVAPAILGR
jgi:DNA-binding NarL/FixJ family response regulator